MDTPDKKCFSGELVFVDENTGERLDDSMIYKQMLYAILDRLTEISYGLIDEKEKKNKR